MPFLDGGIREQIGRRFFLAAMILLVQLSYPNAR